VCVCLAMFVERKACAQQVGLQLPLGAHGEYVFSLPTPSPSHVPPLSPSSSYISLECHHTGTALGELLCLCCCVGVLCSHAIHIAGLGESVVCVCVCVCLREEVCLVHPHVFSHYFSSGLMTMTVCEFFCVVLWCCWCVCCVCVLCVCVVWCVRCCCVCVLCARVWCVVCGL